MPLHSITHAASHQTKLDSDITPAELPSGRVRFSDELGRETALLSRPESRESHAAREPEVSPKREPEEGAAQRSRPPAIGGAKTRSKAASAPAKVPPATARAERGSAAPASDGDDDITLALAELGLAPAPATIPPPPPPAPPDPSGAKAVAKVELAAPAGEDAILPQLGDDSPLSAAAGDANAPESAMTLLHGAEKIAEDAAAPDSKVARAERSKAASDAAPLLAIAASNGAAGTVRATAAETLASPTKSTAPEAAATKAQEAAPRVALAELPHTLPALLDEAEGRVRFGRRGSNWEVDLRLDPPELGALRIRFELHEGSIRGTIHCEPRVERLLGPVLKELEEELGRSGHDASFDLSHRAPNRAPDEEERPLAPQPWRAPPAAASFPPSREPSTRSDPSRLVDVTA